MSALFSRPKPPRVEMPKAGEAPPPPPPPLPTPSVRDLLSIDPQMLAMDPWVQQAQVQQWIAITDSLARLFMDPQVQQYLVECRKTDVYKLWGMAGIALSVARANGYTELLAPWENIYEELFKIWLRPSPQKSGRGRPVGSTIPLDEKRSRDERQLEQVTAGIRMLYDLHGYLPTIPEVMLAIGWHGHPRRMRELLDEFNLSSWHEFRRQVIES
jgi:hypothetical protein